MFNQSTNDDQSFTTRDLTSHIDDMLEILDLDAFFETADQSLCSDSDSDTLDEALWAESEDYCTVIAQELSGISSDLVSELMIPGVNLERYHDDNSFETLSTISEEDSDFESSDEVFTMEIEDVYTEDDYREYLTEEFHSSCFVNDPCYNCHLCTTWRYYSPEQYPCDNSTNHNREYLNFMINRGRYKRAMNSKFCKSCHARVEWCSCKNNTQHYYDQYYDSLSNDFNKMYPQSIESYLKDYLSTDDTSMSPKDWSIKLIEDVSLFILQLMRADGPMDYTLAITMFAKLRTTGPLVNSQFIEKLQSYLSSTFQIKELQSVGESLDKGRKLLESYEEIRSAPIFQKVYKFAMYAMSMSLFDKIGVSFDTLGYSLVEKEAIRRKYYKAPDMIHCFADTLLFLAERGYQIYKTGSIEPLFHSARSYEAWFEKTIDLKRKANLLNDPEFYGFSEAEFLADLDDTIEKGEAIYKHASKVGKYERTSVRNFVNDLYMIKIDYISKRKARESRKAPFSILVSGDSGIGKSTITDLLFFHFGSKEKLPTGSEFRYTRNPVAKFWDGFATSMWCAILDDVAFMNPNKAASGDPSCMEFLQIVNAVPFVPDQADLADKGRTPLRCKLVIATTNTEDLNAYHYFSCPSAAQRRFPFIVAPTPKAQYTNESGMLDSSKVPKDLSEGCYPDLWDWTVKTVRPVPVGSACRKANIETILKDVDLPTFLKWYNKTIDDFNTNQSKVADSIEKMKNIKLCPTCSLPSSMCSCAQTVGETLERGFWISYYILCFIVMSFQFFSYLFTARRAFNTFMSVRRTVKRVQGWKDYLYGTYICTKQSAQPIQSAAFWRDLGSKVQEKISYPYFLGGLAIAIVTGLGVLKFANVVYNLQSSTQKAPTPSSNERNNVWYRSDWEHNNFVSPENSRCLGQHGVETLIKKIKPNAIHFVAETRPDFGFVSRGLCLEGQIYLFNNHSLPEGGFEAHVTMGGKAAGVTSNFSFRVEETQITRDPTNDLALLVLPSLPPKANIIKYFALPSFDVRANGFYLARNESGEITENPVKCLTLCKNQQVGPLKATTDVWLGTASTKTVVGDCGSPLILAGQQGPVIIGIHSLGHKNNIGATSVTQTWIKDMITKVKSMTLETHAPKMSAPSAPQSLGTLHHKSPFRYIDNGTANVYGSIQGFRPANKSRVQTTPMAMIFEGYGYQAKYTKPVLNSWEPWRRAAVSMVNPVSQIKDNLLQECMESFLKDILDSLPKDELAKLEVYDDFTAINGAAGVSYVDSMNRSTSAGFPWNKTKKAFLSPDLPRGGNMDPMKANSEIMDRVRDIEEGYIKAHRAFPIFMGHLKDEPVTFKKAKIAKTRVFLGAPFDWSIVMRKYLLSFIRVVQNNRFIFESAPGTIAQSKEWGDIYRYLTTFGTDRIVAGDYAAFDKRMPASVILAAFEIIYKVCEASGNYDSDDLRIIKGLATDTAFPLCNFNGDLVEFYGSNPSGHPLTVIVNGLANSLYMRYCYRLMNPNSEVTSFKQNVKLMTYGDDNIMGISKEVPWFHHTSIQSSLESIDVQYTMADKEAESVPYIDISEASFLKRTWEWNDEIEDYMCPLDHDSIEKSLMTWVESKTITNEEQMVAVISSAAREYFFYGREVFEEKRKMFQSAIQALDLTLYTKDSTLPTWNSMISMWRESSK